MTDDAAISAMAGKIDEPIDILINNAGVLGEGAAELGHTETGAWLDAFATNVIAPLHVSEALLPHLERGARKLILTISSRAGSSEANLPGGYAYRSSKAAVNRVMRGLSLELADRGFTVVSFTPGRVRTQMTAFDGPLSTEQSVASMRGVIARLTAADNGRFLGYEGRPAPW